MVRYDDCDVLIISTDIKAFERVFIGKNCWYAVTLSKKRIPYLKYVAAYIGRPLSKITHYAEIKEVKPIEKIEKYIIYFKENSQHKLNNPITINSPSEAVQSTKLTTYLKLINSTKMREL